MVLDVFYKGKEYYGLKIFHMLRSLPYPVQAYSGHFQVPTGIGGRTKFCEQIMNVEVTSIPVHYGRKENVIVQGYIGLQYWLHVYEDAGVFCIVVVVMVVI